MRYSREVPNARAAAQVERLHLSESTHILQSRAVAQAELLHPPESTHIGEVHAVGQVKLLHSAESTHITDVTPTQVENFHLAKSTHIQHFGATVQAELPHPAESTHILHSRAAGQVELLVRYSRQALAWGGRSSEVRYSWPVLRFKMARVASEMGTTSGADLAGVRWARSESGC